MLWGHLYRGGLARPGRCCGLYGARASGVLPPCFSPIYCVTPHLLRVIDSILELFAKCATAIRNCCSVFSASCRARNWASMSRSTRTLDVFPDDRLLIQINPSVLLLRSVHRSARRRKD